MNTNENDQDKDDIVNTDVTMTPPVSTSVPQEETPEEEEDDILNSEQDEEEELTTTEDSSVEEDYDDTVSGDSIGDIPADPVSDDILFPGDKIDFRGESIASIRDLIVADEEDIGSSALDSRVRTVGSWENLLFRAVAEGSDEERRIQEALSKLNEGEKELLSSVYRNDEGKILLRTSSIGVKGPQSGETVTVNGDEALLAFENFGTKRGGGYRLPLYNSGITIDIVVPTSNDVQTMLTNCLIFDQQLGASSGGHYFAYADQRYKTQIVNFIQPLIRNSSFTEWRKRDKLWSVIKLSDLSAIVMTIAALCYRNGYNGFIHKCTRPYDDLHPKGCHHTETITADLFKMIVTRFSAMNEKSIEHMVNARAGNKRHNFTQIEKYQDELGLEGEKITIDDISFVMRIPSVKDHIDSGAEFINEIINEIEGDNTEGQYEQVGLRYIRSFVPWIASVEKTIDGATIKTPEKKVIVRELEKMDDKHPDGYFRDALRDYINRSQLTYIGYPIFPCPVCGYSASISSGMYTFDPFSVFFTLAFLYTTTQD